MICKICNKDVNKRFVNGICITCYGRLKENSKRPVYELPKKGEVKYAPDGLVICHICGRAYKKLMAHVWQTHGIYEKDYKREFGLNVSKGLICDETKERLQKSVERHYEKVVEKNLIKGGKKSRFRLGSIGRTRNKLSLQEYNRLVNLAAETNYKNLKAGRAKLKVNE